jgi:hypothetical protein
MANIEEEIRKRLRLIKGGHVRPVGSVTYVEDVEYLISELELVRDPVCEYGGMADAVGLGPTGETREGSSPSTHCKTHSILCIACNGDKQVPTLSLFGTSVRNCFYCNGHGVVFICNDPPQ